MNTTRRASTYNWSGTMLQRGEKKVYKRVSGFSYVTKIDSTHDLAQANHHTNITFWITNNADDSGKDTSMI